MVWSISRWGISREEVEARIAAQNGRCAICGDPPNGRGGFHLDHDHATGKHRGMLCSECNLGLGKFRDSPDRLRAALTYLERYG
jgi:hypothetical protein